MTLSIFNLNCWLFPSPISTDCKTRISAIVGMVRQRNPQIICLQEVWSNKYLNHLKQKFSDYHCVSSGSSFYNQSGLVIFLKEKPISHKTNHFKLSLKQNFTEWFLRKGYIEVSIKLNGIEWKIVNTHLYAAFSKKTEIIIEEQFLELVSKIQEKNVILSGDLNLSEEKFNELNQGKFSRLCDSQNTSDINNPYGHARFNYFIMGNKSKKIDYIIYKSALSAESKHEMIKAPFVSDHYPMFCQVSFM